jgi:hypothetical protein
MKLCGLLVPYSALPSVQKSPIGAHRTFPPYYARIIFGYHGADLALAATAARTPATSYFGYRSGLPVLASRGFNDSPEIVQQQLGRAGEVDSGQTIQIKKMLNIRVPSVSHHNSFSESTRCFPYDTLMDALFHPHIAR